MKLSIIVCAYNERDTILTVLERIQAVAFGPDVQTEIIVVDNCSTDGTDLLQAVTAPNVRVILQRAIWARASVRGSSDDGRLRGDQMPEYHPALTSCWPRPRAPRGSGVQVTGCWAGMAVNGVPMGMRVLTAIANVLFGSSSPTWLTIKMVRGDVFKSLIWRHRV